MKRIFKYNIVAETNYELELPVDAMVLSVGVQVGVPVMWVAGDFERPPIKRTFCVFATGVEVPDFHKLSFIGTFQLEGGALVFHLFEKIV